MPQTSTRFQITEADRALPNRLRVLRKRAQVNGVDLATAMNVDAGTLHKLETGKMALTDEYIRRAAAALGVRQFELMPDAPEGDALEILDLFQRLPDDVQQLALVTVQSWQEQYGEREPDETPSAGTAA